MKISDFIRPRKVWVNAPSSLQPCHRFHGKIGLGVLVRQAYVENGKRFLEDEIVVYFLNEGDYNGTKIDPLYLCEGFLEKTA